MNKETSPGVWEWQIVRLIVFGSFGLFALFLGLKGFTEEGIRLVIRWTAKIDVLCFCVAFGGGAIHYFMKNSFSFWLKMNRKYFGISFAIIHLLHLLALGILQYAFHPVFEKAETISLLAGGVAYLFVVLMLITSFERFRKMMSQGQWKFLHTFGGYWILMIFFNLYFSRVLSGEYTYLFFLILVLCVFGIRLVKWIHGKKQNKTV